VLIQGKLKQVEAIVSEVENLTHRDPGLAEIGWRIVVKLVGQVGDAGMTGGQRWRRDAGSGGGDSDCRSGLEQVAEAEHVLFDAFNDTVMANGKSPWL
jgi:hypothetical protein